MARPFVVPLGVALVTSGCDLPTKYWAIQTTARGSRPLIPGALDLVHTENPGMAFSLMQNWPEGIRTTLLVAVSLVALVAALLAVARRRLSLVATSAIGLVMGGALGNLVDRMHGGTVTDFL